MCVENKIISGSCSKPQTKRFIIFNERQRNSIVHLGSVAVYFYIYAEYIKGNY